MRIPGYHPRQGNVHNNTAYTVNAAWRYWKKCSGVLCNRKMPVNLKGKIYRTAARPTLVYGAETWSIVKNQEKRLEVNDMRMLRLIQAVGD